ncbi:lytic transglycosylase [Hoeflea olei]|uniref:Lytic transglycosylase n=1 Tax=Hoeflea olei TaxID=1480615 RepID=A0A1C1YY91_9HYPH|nr:lytic transglycosylase [Hoeflea olei]
MAWGAMVPEPFRRKTLAIAQRLEMNPDHLMAIMAFETGRSFDPATTNRAGSGATGLIQFMPATARALGTSTAELAGMSALEQLDYVEAYLAPYRGRIGDLASAYMAVLYPRAVDAPPDHVLFRKGSRAYKLNRGLDRRATGQITKADATARVAAMLEEGLAPGRVA